MALRICPTLILTITHCFLGTDKWCHLLMHSVLQRSNRTSPLADLDESVSEVALQIFLLYDLHYSYCKGAAFGLHWSASRSRPGQVSTKLLPAFFATLWPQMVTSPQSDFFFVVFASEHIWGWCCHYMGLLCVLVICGNLMQCNRPPQGKGE